MCRVDNYNAVFFYPIDRKTPKLANLPGLSREMLEQASNDLIIKEELKYKQRAVTIFDPKSFHIPSKPDEKIDIPQIKDVIPLSIAQKLLFVVWFLRWRQEHRYPLGVVIAAIPKGLTLYHGEQLLLAHHHINTAPVDDLDDGVDLVMPSTKPSLPLYDHAFTIDPTGAQAFDDALTLEPVASDDGKCYQLGVHITNVGKVVRKGSGIDNGARERSTAVYGSKLSPIYYPLLPSKVRNNLSLNRGKETSVISYTCQVCIDDKNIRTEPNTVNVCESCVKSRAQLTYEEAQHLLTGAHDASLPEKVADYNNTLPKNSTFALKQRLTLLLQISESFFRNRMQSNDMDYSIEDVDELSSPQTYFLVKELMVWANRISAEFLLTSFPQLTLIRRQKPPNQDQLVKALEKCKYIIGHFPVHKTLADNINVTTEPDPVVITEVLRRQLYEALQCGNIIQAKNLLRITNCHPQLSILCKEVNGTKCQAEYVCSSVLQQQKPLLLDNDSYLVSLPHDVSEVYGHHDLCCLYTHSTSPLRRYIDIVVQRLILQRVSTFDGQYSPEELKEISTKCNTTTMNASKFEKEFICLSIALSLSKCSQTCIVHVASIEKTLNFVIQELDYHCLSLDQRSFRLSSITGNAKPFTTVKPQTEDSQEDCKLADCKTYVWKAKVTSFTSECVVNKVLANVKKCKSSAKPIEDTTLTFYLLETADKDVITTADGVNASEDSYDLALVQQCYTAEFPNKATSLSAGDWKKVTDFMKLPSPDTADQLKDLLCIHNLANKDDAVFPYDASFLLYEVKRSFKVYESFKVSFTASYRDYILSPCIQLLEVAPMLNVCVQHSTKPADCFSSPILSHASKEKYNDIHEYIELWESVLLAEAAVQSVGEAEIQLIQNVPLKWPKLQQPGSSLDDVYYSPFKEDTAKEELADITLTIPAKFEERCGEYFDLQVGNLVCARYDIPLGEEKEVDGRKVTTASAVYHFVIHQIEDPDNNKAQTIVFTKKMSTKKNAKKPSGDSSKVIHLKFTSKDTARVSPFMRQYLKDSTCEIQVIPLDLPYRYMRYHTTDMM